MRTKSVGLQVDVAADQPEAVVSVPFGVSTETSLALAVRVGFAALNAATGITGRLQHSAGDGVWSDVGTEAAFTVTQQAQSLGDYARHTLVMPATDDLTQGDGALVYGIFEGSAVTVAFWVDIDEDGTEPSGNWYLNADYQVTVSVVTDGTGAENAQALVAAIADFTDVAATFGATVDAATVTLVGQETGAVSAPESFTEGGEDASLIEVTQVAAGETRTYIDDDTVTSGSNAFATGDRVVFQTPGELPAGLADLTEAFVIQLDEFTFQLAATQADAAAGVPVSLAGGLGTLTIAKADYTIRLDATDSTDVTQLPLWPTARVVLTTGAGDSATVAQVRAPA